MKHLLTLVLAAMPLLVSAQSKNVTVDAVGQLSKQIESSEKFKISELKISGPLNSSDIKFLQQIVCRTKASEKKGEVVVTSVDLSEAVFTEGKAAIATTKLPNSLFSGAGKLTKVVLPPHITNISKNCFENCKSLPSVDIPSSVVTIESQAFQGCESLAAINIPSGVTVIGSEAFEGCKALTSIDIPKDVKEIGNQAFHSCKALHTISINGDVSKINNEVFRNCENLTSISLPDDLKSIGSDGRYHRETLETRQRCL